MMPAFTFQSPLNTRRAAAIAASLGELDYDIVCFEKAFDGAAREVLSKALGERYPHRYGPANSGFSLKVNSGVWVFSRFPLTVIRQIQFRDCAGIECLSRKGAMLLEGTFKGHAFQIVAAHLQGEAGTTLPRRISRCATGRWRRSATNCALRRMQNPVCRCSSAGRLRYRVSGRLPGDAENFRRSGEWSGKPHHAGSMHCAVSRPGDGKPGPGRRARLHSDSLRRRTRRRVAFDAAPELRLGRAHDQERICRTVTL